MKVFKISVDTRLCQWALPVDTSFVLRFDGTSRVENWAPPEFYIYDPTAKRSDFFIIAPGALGMTQSMRSHPILGMFFEMSGELLPISLENGEQLYVLNVTECVNALDNRRSRMRVDPQTKEPVAIEKYEFISQRLPQSSIFKIPETRISEILAYSGRSEFSDEEFLSAFLSLKMPGLQLTEIWSGE